MLERAKQERSGIAWSRPEGRRRSALTSHLRAAYGRSGHLIGLSIPPPVLHPSPGEGQSTMRLDPWMASGVDEVPDGGCEADLRMGNLSPMTRRILGAGETSNQPGFGESARLLVPADPESLAEEQAAAQCVAASTCQKQLNSSSCPCPLAPCACPTHQRPPPCHHGGPSASSVTNTNSTQRRDLLMR